MARLCADWNVINDDREMCVLFLFSKFALQ
jgi:hypothetical protein